MNGRRHFLVRAAWALGLVAAAETIWVFVSFLRPRQDTGEL